MRETLTIGPVTKLLGCSRSFAYRLAREGKIEHLKLGDRQGIRFYKASVLEYLQSRDWSNI
ncbi:helix-turn-helix domain-containing protein [Trichlorobacter sp.]|jgi:excisionase family DNA binding protein|uniref:helix-turn-helix domain-containing protein n=1 Tax=Trichlorobacter sp. TaxID=2911007 RepID=UPI0039B851D9